MHSKTAPRNRLAKVLPEEWRQYLVAQGCPKRKYTAVCRATLAGGRVIGRSDKTGAFPASDPFTPFDIGATVYEALGLDPDTEIRDPLNRPVRLNTGRPMKVLFENA